MDRVVEVFSILVGSSSTLLDDDSLYCLVSICNAFPVKDALNHYFFHKCISHEFVATIDDYEGVSAKSKLNWLVLYSLNSRILYPEDSNVYYVHFGEFLLSIPGKGRLDAVSETLKSLSLLVSFDFSLYHMTASGLIGPLCLPGQSGSRFVLKPSVSCSRAVSVRCRFPKRGRSLDCPRLGQLGFVNRRVILRDCAEVNNHRSVVFRSHSADHVYNRLTKFSQTVSCFDMQTSSIFPIHEPVVFDFSKLKYVCAKLDSRSPPDFMSILHGIIDQHVHPAYLPPTAAPSLLSRALRHMQEAVLGGHRPAIFDPYTTPRVHAIHELAQSGVPEYIIDKLLLLADSQHVSDRPLLAQIPKIMWREFDKKLTDFRYCAQLIGPTGMWPERGGVCENVCLPEHEIGAPARDRLRLLFTKRFANTIWEVGVIFEEFLPVFFGTGYRQISSMVSRMNLNDCFAGYKIFPNGVLITNWKGLLEYTNETMNISIPRTATCEELIGEISSRIRVRHGIEIQIDNQIGTGTLLNGTLWNSADSVCVCLNAKGQFVFKRKNFVVKKQPGLKIGTKSPLEDDRPLWGSGLVWDSEKTARRLVVSAQRGDDHAGDSPVAMRKRFMDRKGGPELGIDVNTEYSRYWETESHASGTSDDECVSGKDLVGDMQQNVTESESVVSSDEWTPGLVGTRPNSPIMRVRNRAEESKILRSTRDTRQFEFHPFDPNLILLGSRSGVVSIVDANRDFQTCQVRVDSSPILALSWMKLHANFALYGASLSGLVGMVCMESMNYQPICRFGNLSSISINCTDDFLLVSGFSKNISLFDIHTGNCVREFADIHTNFINIVRFANLDPNIYTTSSFDSLCKLWDLRDPNPVATHSSPTLNVMCSFSPNDDRVLVSGLDNSVTQLCVRSGFVPIEMPPITPTNTTTNYRRSVYLADGKRFITSGTDENFVRVIDAQNGTQSRKLVLGSPQEYVQSLRAHPVFSNEMGVLLYPLNKTDPSFVCTASI